MLRILIFLLLPAACLSQVDSISFEIKTEKSKDQIYSTSKAFLDKIFEEGDSYLEIRDKEEGILEGKYIFSYIKGVSYHFVRQKIRIECNEGIAVLTLCSPFRKEVESAINHTGVGRLYKPLKKKKHYIKTHERWEKIKNLLIEQLDGEA